MRISRERKEKKKNPLGSRSLRVETILRTSFLGAVGSSDRFFFFLSEANCLISERNCRNVITGLVRSSRGRAHTPSFLFRLSTPRPDSAWYVSVLRVFILYYLHSFPLKLDRSRRFKTGGPSQPRTLTRYDACHAVIGK